MLKPDSSCLNSLRYLELIKWKLKHRVLSSNYVFKFSNFVFPIAEEITQSSAQVRLRLSLKLIKSISKVFQKLLKYFNGIAIGTSFQLLSAGVFPVMIILDFMDWEFTIAAPRSTL